MTRTAANAIAHLQRNPHVRFIPRSHFVASMRGVLRDKLDAERFRMSSEAVEILQDTSEACLLFGTAPRERKTGSCAPPKGNCHPR